MEGFTTGLWRLENTHRRFCRWRDRGIGEKLLELIMQDPDYAWLMIDATYVKAHQHSAEAVGGNQAMSVSKWGLNSKIHLAMDAHDVPVRAIITDDTAADCTKAEELISGIAAKHLLADRGYDAMK
jgi:transposase